MKDIILDRFEKVLIQIQKTAAFFESENDLEFLKMTCIDFAKFTYLKQGNLFILAQLMDEFKSKEIDYIDHNIFYQDSLDLISKYNYDNIQYFSLPIAERRDAKNRNNKQLIDLKYKIKEDKYLKLWQLKFETKSQIKAKYNYLKSQIFTYLDLMFYQNNEFRNKIEPFDLDVVSEDKIKFYDSWHFGRASIEKWIKFPTTEFLDVPIYQKRSIAEKVKKIQQRLFQKALQNELNELLSALAKGNKIINFKRFLDLSENFINGNLNEIDLKRFTVFMNFDRADEVLIELDNILMEKEINFRKYLPYDGPNKIKSPRFTAELILLFGSECTKTLKLYTNKGSIKDLNDVKFTFTKKFIPKHRVNSFQFIQSHTNHTKFKAILRELNNKFHLIKLNEQVFTELLEVLTSPDYSKLNIKVHIDCKTHVFSYIFKQLKPFFSNLTGKEIEDSQIFLTKINKKPLTSTNYNKSSISKTIEKEEIRKIISS